MNNHELKVNWEDGRLVAVCSCGRWEQTARLEQPGDLVSDLLGVLERRHCEHITKAAEPGEGEEP